MKVLYTNADQFINKRDDLCMLIADQEPHLMLLTEIIPKAQVFPISAALLAIPGYSMYTNFDVGKQNLGSSGLRGICIYVKTELKATQVSFDDSFSEQLWVKIALLGSDILIAGCIYRSPSGDGRQSSDQLCRLLKKVVSSRPSHLLITGDFNMPQIDWTLGFSSAHIDHYTQDFIETTRDCFLHQHVTMPTRFRRNEEPHTLDLIFSNEEGMVQNLLAAPGLGSSDHVVLTFALACYTVHHSSAEVHLNLNRADFNRLNIQIAAADWEVEDEASIHEHYTQFKHTLNNLINDCIPRSRPKKMKANIYINRDALKLKKRKSSLWRSYTLSGDNATYASYVRCRNDLRKLTRSLRKTFEQRLAADLKTNNKAFWRYANTRLKTKSRIEDLKHEDGSMAVTSTEKANMLNQFFSSKFTVEDNSVSPTPLHNYNGPPLETVDLNVQEVARKLSNLKPFSSQGPDGLHPRVLRETATTLSGPLTALFRRSVNSGILPSDWKIGEVTPIFKKGSKQSPTNYRPVSLTSVPCKVLESIIRDQMMEHLNSSQLLHDAQHGFRSKRSCTTQLLTTMEDWSKMIEGGKPVDAVYLDFSKAFDSVPHKRLLNKLKSYGVEGQLLRWIEAFLTDRQQRVVVNGSKSCWVPVTSGVPQGSVLGPLLFLLFVNDIPEVVQGHIKLFADDTKLYRPVPSHNDTAQLQRDLDALAAWSDTWQLPFNADKCKTVHFGAKNMRQVYSMRDVDLEQVSGERDLGVHIDDDLKFRKHAAAAVSKASQMLAVVRRSFKLFSLVTLPLLMKTLIRPHLEYGNTVWGPFYRADQKLVERVQRRATRLVSCIRTLPYPERLRQLGLPSLYYRRRRGDMITVYQLIHSGLDLDPDFFFSPATTTTTRGHPWKLIKPRAVSRIRRHAFSVRVVNDWNSLPLHVVTSETVNQFKSRLDSHWAHLLYTIPD